MKDLQFPIPAYYVCISTMNPTDIIIYQIDLVDKIIDNSSFAWKAITKGTIWPHQNSVENSGLTIEERSSIIKNVSRIVFDLQSAIELIKTHLFVETAILENKLYDAIIVTRKLTKELLEQNHIAFNSEWNLNTIKEFQKTLPSTFELLNKL